MSLSGLLNLEISAGIKEEWLVLIINICKPLLIYSIMQRGSKISLIAPLNTWIDRFKKIYIY